MRTLVVALETVNGAQGIVPGQRARNGYPLAAIAGEAKLETGVSKNPVVAIWEGEMDVASVRNDRATSAGKSMRCRHCGTPLQHTLIDLGMSPLCESFLTQDQLDAPETYYPLHARVCHSCWLVQLPEFVSPAHIFTEYAYFSSYSTTWVAHAARYCEMIKSRLGLGPKSFVVELGSNDGYLLQHFVDLGMPVLGIEPAANVAEAARKAGIPTLVAFFGAKTAGQVVVDHGHADLIVANNVLAQVPELNDFVVGMAHLLAPEGVITIEVPHLERLIAENQFDTIYHEHFSYFLARQHEPAWLPPMGLR